MSPPPESAGSSAVFFARAGEEAERYGPDDWVFLRELVQNSRDARARRIDISVRVTALDEEITFEDDGVGMNADIVERYLIRLYASTKTQDGSVGYFGVGFWSIVRFAPRSVTVVSRSVDESTGIHIDCRTHRIATHSATLDHVGTRVTLVRDAGSGPRPTDDLPGLVRERVLAYAAHVRPFRGDPPLELWLNGERLDRPFPAPPHGCRRFVGKGFDGVVGFGPEPIVRVYTEGILVRAMTSLDEVIPSHPVQAPGGGGLYPVVYLNVEGLRVLMDRQHLFEDQRLKDALNRCARELRASHQRVLRDVLPLDLRNLWWRTLGRVRLGHALVVMVVTGSVLAAISGGLALHTHVGFAPAAVARPRVGPRAVDEIEQAMCGHSPASTTPPAVEGWDFFYDGPSEVLFMARILTSLDPARGFSAAPLNPRRPYPSYPDTGDGRITVRMRLRGMPSLMVVPTPVGHAVARGSVRHDGTDVQVWEGEMGEPLIAAPSAGWVSYATVPRRESRPCGAFAAEDLPWPASVRAMVVAAREHAPQARVETLARFVRERFVYDRRPAPGPPGSWLEAALTNGRGDCDVINGILAALLRSAGVNAHLAVGIVGSGGHASAALHAVVTYCIDGWQTLDVTAEAREDGGDPVGGEDRHGLFVPGSRAPQRDGRLFLPWVIGLLATLGIAGAVVERRARMARPDPRHVRSLFDHLYDGSGAADDLRYRPVVPMIGGRMASLFQLERMASRRGLFGARPGSAAVRAVRGHQLIDRSSPLTQALVPYLPPPTWLDDPWWDAALPESLQHVEKVLRSVDEGIRLHLVPESAVIAGVSVRFRRGGRYHVVLGERHPAVAAIRTLAEQDRDGVSAAAAVVEALPFYFCRAERFLGALHRGSRTARIGSHPRTGHV